MDLTKKNVNNAFFKELTRLKSCKRKIWKWRDNYKKSSLRTTWTLAAQPLSQSLHFKKQKMKVNKTHKIGLVHKKGFPKK